MRIPGFRPLLHADSSESQRTVTMKFRQIQIRYRPIWLIWQDFSQMYGTIDKFTARFAQGEAGHKWLIAPKESYGLSVSRNRYTVSCCRARGTFVRCTEAGNSPWRLAGGTKRAWPDGNCSVTC